jgi:hypothetical protein
MRYDFNISVGTSGGADHLAYGFGSDERENGNAFAWNSGPTSEVVGTLVDPHSLHVLMVSAQAAAGAASRRTRVVINGQPVGVVDFTSDWTAQSLRVPSDLLKTGVNRVRFEYETTVTPASLSATSADDRQLAVRFKSIQLVPLPSLSLIDFGNPESRLPLLRGWSVDEVENGRSVIWSVGSRSSLALVLHGSKDVTLEVDARAYVPALPVNVNVTLNGRSVGSFSPHAEFETFSVPLPSALFSKSGDVIEFCFDRTARPSRHDRQSRDERELAVRFDELRIRR